MRRTFALGFAAINATFRFVPIFLNYLGETSTSAHNNPNKIETMKKSDQYVERVPLNVGENRYNTEYRYESKKNGTLYCA